LPLRRIRASIVGPSAAAVVAAAGPKSVNRATNTPNARLDRRA
jgi:hypothetical protein